MNISRHLSSMNSGHIELILILGIFVLSKIYLSSSANLDGTLCSHSLIGRLGGFVVSSHHADRFTHVKTTSFHPAFSKSSISCTMSSLSL
ncbi:MAG: hypothetical protein Q8S84_04720 [bacterium]|nr:hypothetical protein [bacterium]MDP3380804.1 hypothetical protein [bacterium]